jgi:hypothetical protein
MGNRFASGRNAIAECDRCSFRFKLKELRSEVVKGRNINNLVCPQCWSPDQPQLMLGTFPIDDPQALRNPRPDRSYVVSGTLPDGSQGEGSRTIQWGWNPVGGSRFFDDALTPNPLALVVQIGTVTVTLT